MNDRTRSFLHDLARDLGGVVRGSLSRTPEERAASAARWEALMARAQEPARDGFRDDLHGILSDVVERLEALHDELLPDDPRSSVPSRDRVVEREPRRPPQASARSSDSGS